MCVVDGVCIGCLLGLLGVGIDVMRDQSGERENESLLIRQYYIMDTCLDSLYSIV